MDAIQEKQVTEGFLSLQDVKALVGVSASTLLRWECEKRFPLRRTLGSNSVRWLESEVMEWVRTRPAVRRSSQE